MTDKKIFDPITRENFSALVNITRYRNVPLVKQAIQNGQYGTINLEQAQRTLLSLRKTYPQLGLGLPITEGYNPVVFESLINQFQEIRTANQQLLIDLVKEAVDKNDPSLLEHFPAKIPTKQHPEDIPAKPYQERGEIPGQKDKTSPETNKTTVDQPVSKGKPQPPLVVQDTKLEQDKQETQEGNTSSERQKNEKSQENQENQESKQEDSNNKNNQDNRGRNNSKTEKPDNKIKNKIKNSRPGRWVSNKFNAIADRMGLQRLGSVIGKSTSPFRYLNNLPSRVGDSIRSGLRGFGSRSVSSAIRLGSQLGRAFAASAARMLSGLASRALAQAGSAAARSTIGAAARGLALIALNPITWIIVGIVALFFFVWWYDQLIGNAECNKPEGVMKIVKQADNIVRPKLEYGNGEQIDYVIQVTYELACRSRVLSTLEVTDTIPEGTTYVEGSAESGFFLSRGNSTGVYDDATRTVTWTFKDFPTDSPLYLYLSVKTDPGVKGDFWLSNQATVKYTIAGGNSFVPNGGDESANQETCVGRIPDWPAGYIFEHPTAGNFGDPSCSFSKNSLHELLKQADPANADYWFDVVVKKESGYNPNTWANPVTVGTPDAEGAWGLFQMGRGKNGQYDRGDVAWQKQTSNAVAYNNYITGLGRPWCYWQAARERWPALCRR